MVKLMKIISHQRFGECVCKIFAGVFLTHLQISIVNMISNKMLAKRRGFLVQGAIMICRIQPHTHVVPQIQVWVWMP